MNRRTFTPPPGHRAGVCVSSPAWALRGVALLVLCSLVAKPALARCLDEDSLQAFTETPAATGTVAPAEPRLTLQSLVEIGRASCRERV